LKGEIRAFNRGQLFLQVKPELYTPEGVKVALRSTNGYLCCPAKEVSVSGAEFVKVIQPPD
jgi:hypothetical protein